MQLYNVNQLLPVPSNENRAESDNRQGPEQLVLVICRRLELPDRPGHHTGELRVHGYVGVIRRDPTNLLELFLQVVAPYFTDPENKVFTSIRKYVAHNGKYF